MVFRTWFSGLGISTLGPGFSHSWFPRPKPENFFFFVFFVDRQGCCFFFLSALKCRRRRTVFLFFALNCRRRRTGFFFSLSVHSRLSVTTCSTLHPSDVGFFTSFNEKNLATFTSCSIFKTFVPTYLPTKGDGFGVKEKKKVGTGGLCPIVMGTH